MWTINQNLHPSLTVGMSRVLCASESRENIDRIQAIMHGGDHVNIEHCNDLYRVYIVKLGHHSTLPFKTGKGR